jgi:hypothetical protein
MGYHVALFGAEEPLGEGSNEGNLDQQTHDRLREYVATIAAEDQ